MGKIQVLPEQVSNKIAAGEVVERPASVVKELVENSIDAGSDRIKVIVESGGKKLIQIIDNGSGMDKEDALLAFERHATSKIKKSNDLFSLRTLGFRGEALASIASVSRLELKTKQEGQLEGFRVNLEGGEIKKKESYGCPKGTNIVVKDLFYNTPVRYKYLKQDSTEMRHISNIVTRLSLAYPDISFNLTHNNKSRFETSGNGRLIDVIYNLYGSDVARKMIKVNYEDDYMKLRGYISQPEITRSSKKYQSVFVNGRYIRSNLISKAVMDAYKSVLTINNYPLAVLKLKLNPILVDVNIHPTKLRAKFSRKGKVYDLVKDGVKETFADSSLIPDFKFKEQKNNKQESKQSPSSNEKSSGKRKGDNYRINFKQVHQTNKGESKAERKKKIDKLYKTDNATVELKEEKQNDREKETIDKDNRADEEVSQYEAELETFKAIGQVNNSYILAQARDGLYIIDQHAAHEQVLYHKLLARAENNQIQIQSLLMPLRFQLTPEEGEIIISRQDKLQKLGFEIEEFGSGEYVIQGVPTLLKKLDDKNEIITAIEEIINNSKVNKTDFVDEFLTEVACKTALKAGDKMAMPEIKALLADIEKYEITNCPHGRPVIINISWQELDKKFKRT